MVIRMTDQTSASALLSALTTAPTKTSVVRQVPNAQARAEAAAAFAMSDTEEDTPLELNADVVEEDEIEEEGFTMPDCIEPVPDGSYTSGTRLDIKLYTANCLGCTSLNPNGDKTYSACHYTKGNPFCPAKDVKFAFVGEQAIFAERINRAKANDDKDRVFNLLMKLQEKDADFRNAVMQKIGLLN